MSIVLLKICLVASTFSFQRVWPKKTAERARLFTGSHARAAGEGESSCIRRPDFFRVSLVDVYARVRRRHSGNQLAL